jgi:suppressor of G2 allele of SKP1
MGDVSLAGDTAEVLEARGAALFAGGSFALALDSFTQADKLLQSASPPDDVATRRVRQWQRKCACELEAAQKQNQDTCSVSVSPLPTNTPPAVSGKAPHAAVVEVPPHSWTQADATVALRLTLPTAALDPQRIGVAVTGGGRTLRVVLTGMVALTFTLAAGVTAEKHSVMCGRSAAIITLFKASPGLWPAVEAGSPVAAPPPAVVASSPASAKPKATTKDWSAVVADVEAEEAEALRTAGGDASLNALFQQIYASADEDTRRAMQKSYVESGGTCLSTDWKDVGARRVDVSPPDGMEARPYSGA